MTRETPNNTEFRLLMEGVAAGSEEAAWKITEVYTPHILKVVRAALPTIIRPKLDSADFTQAVWATLLEKRTYLGRVHSPQQLVGLLVATARNKVVDAYRHYTATAARNVRREEPIDPAAQSSDGDRANAHKLAGRDPSPSQVASVRENWRQTVDRSSPRDRRILALRMKGLTCGQIAESLEISSATVRRTLDRLISELQS